ncbi:ISAs1 family transposase [Parafrankia soli]|uniref:ISAs1 family transposase n=1 Tax=Parafrankia soli TaxID=2599596 RepID=UPI0009F5DBCD|nr:ISAs1 family transposase [Parafrankia soli]
MIGSAGSSTNTGRPHNSNPVSGTHRRFVAPSESIIRRVLEKTDAAALDLAVGAWLFARATRDDDGDLVIALDGKVLRGAWTGENQQVTLFSAMFHREGVVVAQTQVPDGTNEITQVENLLENIAITPGQTIVTLDAAHTQRETALYLQKRGIDYLMNVKGNQPTLHAKVFSRCLPLLQEDPGNVVEERSHGRIIRWTTWTTTADGIDFPNAATVAVIRREEFDLAGRRVTKEYAFIITSLHGRHASAETIHTHVCQHWGIENRVRYVRDTTWREDANQTYSGNGPRTLAVLRNLALSLFRLHGITKVKETTEFIARDRNRALTLLAT